MQTTTPELRQILVFIWTKILALDKVHDLVVTQHLCCLIFHFCVFHLCLFFLIWSCLFPFCYYYLRSTHTEIWIYTSNTSWTPVDSIHISLFFLFLFVLCCDTLPCFWRPIGHEFATFVLLKLLKFFSSVYKADFKRMMWYFLYAICDRPIVWSLIYRTRC